MATTSRRLTSAEVLERRLKEHRAEMAKAQARGEDPTEELGALLRDRFGLEALRETYAEFRQDTTSWPGIGGDPERDGW